MHLVKKKKKKSLNNINSTNKFPSQILFVIKQMAKDNASEKSVKQKHKFD